MNSCSTGYLVKTLIKRLLQTPFHWIPEGKSKFKIRSAMLSKLRGIPNEFLINAGETVLLVGVHRIDTVMLWSCLAGPLGRVVVIEAVPDYIENIRRNLEHHLNWPNHNIIYIAKGVDSAKGQKAIQIGERADYNKLANQSIEDGLSAADYAREVEIDLDTIDQILSDQGIAKVDYVYMTISGMEVEALKGMKKTLQTDGIRIQIRSLHTKNQESLYLQASSMLEEAGLATAVGRPNYKFKGRDIYASRL